FNTLYKLVWLKENHPQLLERAHAWLFISSLINHRLTGEVTTDITMAGTSQMLDNQQRQFSPQTLTTTGICILYKHETCPQKEERRPRGGGDGKKKKKKK
ncbi:FGGY family carbohydrate kinase, partial [Escherichia coli]|uniref:FGGY family carbohydrate kinase n=1 Tax=Escherichia coli TaxID=562 RepID=UPI0020245233